MSVWKKASKANQKTHRERHQPEDRRNLGLLEKKKDYIQRAKDYNDKQATIKLLRKRALNRNPEEFYHHMINSKVDNGVHHEKETEDEDTLEQIQLMQSQDLKYITNKRTQEFRKIERMQSQLHMVNVNKDVKNKHKFFVDPKDPDSIKNIKKRKIEALSKEELPDIDVNVLKAAACKQKSVYKELGKRVQRERELSIIQQKIEIKKQLQSKSRLLAPKKLKRGTKDSAPVYKWKYERKK